MCWGGCGGTPDTRYPAAAGTANLIFDDGDDDAEPDAAELVAVASHKIRVGVAVGSGASDNAIGLDDPPAGVVPGGPPGPPFSDARGGDIKEFGEVVTRMESSPMGRWAAGGLLAPSRGHCIRSARSLDLRRDQGCRTSCSTTASVLSCLPASSSFCWSISNLLRDTHAAGSVLR